MNPFVELASAMAAHRLQEQLGVELRPEQVLQHMGDSGIDFEAVGVERTKQQILREHEKSLQDMRRMVAQTGMFHVSSTNTHDVKPANDFRGPPRLSSLNPIGCDELTPQTAHR